MIFRTFSKGGIHPEENKLSADKPTEVAPLPKIATFPLSQHIGAPAKAVVKKGDRVKVGTLLAEAGGFVSAPIHSSVSGVVAKVDAAIDASGYRRPAIVINVEGDEWEDGIDRTPDLETMEAHEDLTAEEIVDRIKKAGVTGMGGAGFPTFIKLTPKDAKAECVVINGVECEPYITADDRLMIEHSEEIVVGIQLLMKAVGVDEAFIGIEENKPSAIERMQAATAGKPGIQVVALRKKYPQGGEKQLIDAVLGRQVPAPPAIPIAVGAVVQNVATAFAVYEAVMKNKPLFERYTTVTGKEIANPSNLLVRMGTPVGMLIDYCGGMPVSENKVLMGGPMMGKSLVSLDCPVVKGSNAVTIISGRDAHRHHEGPCLRCAKCVDVCPMGLEPYLLATVASMKLWDKAEENDVVSCIECGSCQYTCPSYRPLLDNIRNGKQKVMAMIRSRKK